MAIQKLRGKKFGFALFSKAKQRRLTALGLKACAAMATERAEAYRPPIEWAFRQKGQIPGPISYGAAARILNMRNLSGPKGGIWRGHQLKRIALRIGLRQLRGYLASDIVRARVRAIWRDDPNCTLEQMRARMKTEHPVGLLRVRHYLRRCQGGAAKSCAAYERLGWPIDR
jgi:hypothetical protein